MTGNRELFIKVMSQGHSAAWEQKWEQAAGYYRQALAEIADDPTALNSLGLALFEMREYGEALKYYQQAARSVPEDPLPFEKIGAIFETQKDYSKAVQAFAQAGELHLKGRNAEKSIENWIKALNLKPDHLLARSRLAFIFERMGRRIEAAAEYNAVASLLQHKNDVQKAVQTAEYALKLMPDNVETKHTLAMLRSNQRLPLPDKPKKPSGSLRLQDSQQLLEAPKSTVKQFDPIEEGRQRALSRLAEILFDESESTETEQSDHRGISAIARGTGRLKSKQADKTRALLHLGQAIDSETKEDHDQAAKELERAIDLGVDHPAAHFILGMITVEKNRQKATQRLQTSVKHPRYALPSYLLLAKIYQSNQEYNQALIYYLQALRLADADTLPTKQANEIHQAYEPILENQAHQQREETELRKLCESIADQLIRPNWRQFLQVARQQLSPSHKGDSLVPLAEILLETDGGSVIEAMNRVKNLAASQMIRTAIEEAYDAIEITPTYLPLHIQIAELLVQQGRTQEAVTKFMLAADLYALRGEAAQAVRLLSRVAQMAPMDLIVQTKLIEMLVSQGRIDEAIEQHLEMARIYYQLAELDLSRQTYTSALRLSHRSSNDRTWSLQILYKIADIDMQLLDWKQAIRILEQIRTLEPEDINARTQLVSLNFRLGQDYASMAEVESFSAVMENSGKRKKIIEFLQLVLQEHPDKLDLKKHLADLYTREGNPNQAIKTLESIADSLLKSGNLSQASVIIEKIIVLNPPNAAEYQKVLGKIQARLGKAGAS